MEVFFNPDAREPLGENWVYKNGYYIEKYGLGPFSAKDNGMKLFIVEFTNDYRPMYKSRFLPIEIKNVPYEDML